MRSQTQPADPVLRETLKSDILFNSGKSGHFLRFTVSKVECEVNRCVIDRIIAQGCLLHLSTFPHFSLEGKLSN